MGVIKFTETISLDENAEKVFVWRPMRADRIEENIYRVKLHPDFDPDNEVLAFKPGEIVVCERQKKSGQYCLVAIKKSNNA
ncbi:MAG: hypothetical protein JST26_04470 [Bacteroidetes bacterium]|nr:hypothetical protein [Bacteroidota bacterium]